MYTPDSDLSSELRSWSLQRISSWISHQDFNLNVPPQEFSGHLLSFSLCPNLGFLSCPSCCRQRPEHCPIFLPFPHPTAVPLGKPVNSPPQWILGAHFSPSLLPPLVPAISCSTWTSAKLPAAAGVDSLTQQPLEAPCAHSFSWLSQPCFRCPYLPFQLHLMHLPALLTTLTFFLTVLKCAKLAVRLLSLCMLFLLLPSSLLGMLQPPALCGLSLFLLYPESHCVGGAEPFLVSLYKDNGPSNCSLVTGLHSFSS